MRTIALRRLGSITLLALVSGLLVGPVLTAPAEAAPAATLSGRVTDAGTGNAVADACVTLFEPSRGHELAHVCTGADGRYEVAGLPDGSAVRIRVVRAGYVEQWWPDKPDHANAQLARPTAAAPVVADVALRTAAAAIQGRLTEPEGGPAGWAQVRLSGAGWQATVRTRVDGTYRLDGIPPGDYTASLIQFGLGGVTVDGIHLDAGEEEVLDRAFTTRFSASPLTSRVSGSVRDRVTDAPVAGAEVTLLSEARQEIARITTGADGGFSITGIPLAVRFAVRAVAAGFTPLWAVDGPDFPYAGRTELLSSGQTAFYHLLLRRTAGNVSGRLRDPSGVPVAGDALLVRPNGTSLLIRTRVDGSFDVAGVAPGTYRARILVGGLGQQWAHGRETEEEADPVEVTDGGTTVLDERFLPRGAVEVRVVDSRSGAPVAGGCVLASAPAYGSRTVCTGPSGVVTLPDAPPGFVDVSVFPGNDHMDGHLPQVRVRSAQTTQVTIPVRPAGMIRLTVPRTPAGAVPRVCAYAVPVGLAAAWPTESSGPLCNLAEQGNPVETATIGPISAERVQLFLLPQAPYGAQWLGASGGTGDRRQAAVLDIGTGRTVDTPQIRLDPGGSILVTVRDRDNGTLTRFPCARPYGLVAGLEMVSTNVPFVTNCSQNGDGQVRLEGLGPYGWPVEIITAGYAGLWSGGAHDRFSATPVQVPAGGTAALNVSLGREARLVSFDFGANPPEFWSVTAFHPTTGDMVGTSAVYHNAVLGGLNTGPVLLRYANHARGAEPCWYTARAANGTRRPGPPSAVRVTAGEEISGIRLIPGSTCVTTAPGSTAPIPKRPAHPAGPSVPDPGPAAPATPTGTAPLVPYRPPKPPRLR